MLSIGQRIASELNVQEWQVKAAVDLLDGGSTVPFIARYRKEVTGTLDDAQLRTLEERLGYLRELETRRKTILDSIREQGKLTDELALQINTADTKARLEDLYLPYKPKRRTKAQIAKEAGLEPLADLLLNEPTRDPKEAAGAFVNAEKEIATPEAALEGARSILVERFAENAELLGGLRDIYWERGSLLRIAGRLAQESVGQRLQACFLGDLRLGPTLGLVGQVEVFEPCLGVGGVDLERQLVAELALLADAVEDRLAPVLQLTEVAQALLQGAQLGIVQGAGDFLAVARDEGNGGTAVEQLDGCLNLPFLNIQFVRNALTDG